MKIEKTTWLGLASCFFMSLFALSPASAQQSASFEAGASVVYAEPGNWWDIARPGEGLVMERHGNTVAMVLFTYTANGDPEFYIASAPLSRRNFTPVSPFFHGMQGVATAKGDLYRFKNGPIFNSDQRFLRGGPPANESERVGSIEAYNLPMTDTLHVRIELDEDKVPEGAQLVTERQYQKSIFGFAGFGKYVDAEVASLQASRACWVDLRGRWVFADQSDNDSQEVWSFDFTELETTPAIDSMTCRNSSRAAILADHTLTYRDTTAGATLRCVAKNIHPQDDENYQPEDQRCVLRLENGEALMWFSVRDVAAKQIIGTFGEPPNDYRYWRGNESGDFRRITGLRVH